MTLHEDFSRLRNVANELGTRTRTAVSVLKDTRAERELRKRAAAEYGLTRIATALAKTVDGLRQGEFPDYALSFLDLDTHEGLALELKGTGLSLGFQGDDVCVDHRQDVNGVPTRAAFSFSMYKESKHVVSEATVRMKSGASAPEYSLVLDPREPGFEEDGVMRQLARQALDDSNLIFGTVTEMAREQMREATVQETEIDSIHDGDNRDQPLTQEQQYLLQNSFPHMAPHIPPIQPYKAPYVEEGRQLMRLNDTEKSQEITSQIETCAREITHLRAIKIEDLPYHDIDPRLATYVAKNSIAVHTDTHPRPIGIISAQPETGTLLFQALTDTGDFLPTVVFNNPNFSPSETIETLQLGFTPYANPYDLNRTTLYPITVDGIKASTLLAQTLLQRLTVDIEKDIDFDLSLRALNGMPYIGMDPQSFFAFAEETIQAAIPDKEAVQLTADYFDYKRHGARIAQKTPDIPDFAISLDKRGSKNTTLIWFDEAKQTTTVAFEVTTGENTQPHKITLNFNADSFTMTTFAKDPKGNEMPTTVRITPELIAQDAGWNEVLHRLGRQLYQAEDAWKMVQQDGKFEPFITEGTKLQIDGLFDDLWELVRKKGDVANMAAYVGGNPTTLVKLEPLHVDSEVWLPTGTEAKIRTADGNTEKVSLKAPLFAPSDLELESYPENSFLGQLHKEAKTTAETGEHPIIRIVDGHIFTQDLIDADVFGQSPLLMPETVADQDISPDTKSAEREELSTASTTAQKTVETKETSPLPEMGTSEESLEEHGDEAALQSLEDTLSSAEPRQQETQHPMDTDSMTPSSPSEEDLEAFAREFLRTDTSEGEEDVETPIEEAKEPKVVARETPTPRQRTRRSIADGTKEQRKKIKPGVSKKSTSGPTRPSVQTSRKSPASHVGSAKGNTTHTKRNGSASGKTRS